MKNILENALYVALILFLIASGKALMTDMSLSKTNSKAIGSLEERVSLLEETSPYFHWMTQDSVEEMEAAE